jgi:hypothetical protein
VKRILTAMCLAALAGCGNADDIAANNDDAGVTTVNEVPGERVTPTPMCSDGEVWCGASCEDLQTSLGSCGYCNLHCPHNMTCVKGVCTEK